MRSNLLDETDVDLSFQTVGSQTELTNADDQFASNARYWSTDAQQTLLELVQHVQAANRSGLDLQLGEELVKMPA